MCEICDLVKEHEKTQRELVFRIQQHSHAMIMGNTDEAAIAQTSAVTALYSLLNCQRRMIAMAEKLGHKDLLEEMMSLDKKSPSMH